MRKRTGDVGHHEIAFQVEGKNLQSLKNEAGGLRVQRISPTEKRGRVHTSTTTVAVINPDVSVSSAFSKREESDFRIEWFSGTGKGGQHRNRHMNSCRLFHIPTGLMESRQGRKRESNLKDAKSALTRRLDNAMKEEAGSIISTQRKEMVGSGMRGDKVRTIRFQDDRITDHRSNKTMTAKKFMKGFMDLLW